MLSLQSQCLLRQKELFNEGRWLLVNPTDAFIFNELPDSVSGFHQYYDQFLAASINQPERHVFGAVYPSVTEQSQDRSKAQFDGIVLYLPKAKKHTAWLLKHLANLLNKEGFLCIVGENKGGVKSCGKLLETVGTHANKIESARHCSVFASVVSDVPQFELEKSVSWFSSQVKGQQLKVATLPGVFSHGELDGGTQLLLENINDVPDGKILDFACGNGVIGSYLARLNPKIQLTLSDVSALAVYCSKQTFHNVSEHADDKTKPPASIVASDGLKQIEGKYRAIYTNPPFHKGIANDYNITQQFITDAAAKLAPRGELWLVANHFLPYAEHLERHFGSFRRAAETTRFILYHCIKS